MQMSLLLIAADSPPTFFLVCFFSPLCSVLFLFCCVMFVFSSPNRLQVQSGDYLHFQWTGSNTNPLNNAGNGLDGTDRSNVVVLRSAQFDDHYASTSPPTKGVWGNSYPSRVDDAIRFAGLSAADQTYLATLQQVPGVSMPGAQFGGHMDQFDDAGTYVRTHSHTHTHRNMHTPSAHWRSGCSRASVLSSDTHCPLCLFVLSFSAVRLGCSSSDFERRVPLFVYSQQRFQQP